MEITIRNLQKKVPLEPTKIKKAILKTLRFENIKKSARITVIFVNDKKIRELNLLYRNKNSPTDVLSFDNSLNKNEILSDIVISVDTAYRNARLFKTSSLYEVYLYIIHGLLHVLGYDDRTAKQRKLMEDKASRILNALNIKR